MLYHNLPDIPLPLSVLGIGAAPFGAYVDGETLDRLFGMYLDAGGNFFDTAHCYCFWVEGGNGTSERTLGALVRRHGVRDRVVIATKGGHPEAGEAYPRPDCYLAPETIAADVEDSLGRLGMDSVDLYYLHRDDARVPVGEIIETLNAEIDRGRIRALGASNWRTERIDAANAYAAAHGLRGFVISQPQWSLAQSTREAGEDPVMRQLLPDDVRWHAARQFPAAAYSAAANGFFAGRAVEQYDLPCNHVRRARARQLAAELASTPTQIALAWLLHHPFPVFPLTSTCNPDHLAESLGAVAVTLTAEQVRWLGE